MTEFNKYIGLDVHKEKISVAIADLGREQPRYWGEIHNRPAPVKKLIVRLSSEGERLRLCYEAGPCGYELYRQLVAAGHSCVVVAPALIPRKPGERIKTNRRDCMNLARLDRAGELTEVWVPDAAQEAMRDLSRAREDMKILDKQLRQRLSGLLLRRGRIYSLFGVGSRPNVSRCRSNRSCSKNTPKQCAPHRPAQQDWKSNSMSRRKGGAWMRRRGRPWRCGA